MSFVANRIDADTGIMVIRLMKNSSGDPFCVKWRATLKESSIIDRRNTRGCDNFPNTVAVTLDKCDSILFKIEQSNIWIGDKTILFYV